MIAFLGIMVVANALAGSLFGELPKMQLSAWGISLEKLVDGEVFRLVSAVFLSHNQSMAIRQLLFAATVIGIHEWRSGSWNTLLMFWVTDILGSVFIFFAIGVVPSSIGPLSIDDIASQHDIGMSGGGFGLLGSIVAGLTWRWYIFIAGLAALLLKIVLAPDVIADALHIVTFILGFTVRHVFVRLLNRNVRAS